jgi:hypothetical protein
MVQLLVGNVAIAICVSELTIGWYYNENARKERQASKPLKLGAELSRLRQLKRSTAVAVYIWGSMLS